jgi:hypothetical protein
MIEITTTAANVRVVPELRHQADFVAYPFIPRERTSVARGKAEVA